MNPQPWPYKYYFLDLLYRISHGFDRTQGLSVMAWHFKDILRFVFFTYTTGVSCVSCLRVYQPDD